VNDRRTHQDPVDSRLVDRIDVASQLKTRLFREFIVIRRDAARACEIEPQRGSDRDRDRQPASSRLGDVGRAIADPTATTSVGHEREHTSA